MERVQESTEESQGKPQKVKISQSYIGAKMSFHPSVDFAFEPNYVQRWAKKWTFFAKQQPGRARHRILAT